jgi:flagellar hook-basal body complex protein FliE
MDGLTISTAENLLESGRTVSELRKDQMRNDLQTDSLNPGEKNFADTLKDAMDSVNTLQKTSDVMMKNLATGEQKNIPEVMIAAEKADVALKLMVQVRNKIIDAYQEIMKMQV